MKQEISNESYLKSFGLHIKKIRLNKNLTQEEVAELSEFTRSYYTEIETGKRNTSLLNLYKISKALEVEMKELVDFTIKVEDENG